MEMFSQFGSWFAGLMFFWTIYQHYLPPKLRDSIEFFTSRYTHKFANYFSPYLDITFDEHTDDRFNRSEVYIAIQNYLSDKSSMEARSMKADYMNDSKSLLLKLGENEEVMDDYLGFLVFMSGGLSIKKSLISLPSLSMVALMNKKGTYWFVLATL